VLHNFTNLSLPVGALKSYSIYAGVQEPVLTLFVIAMTAYGMATFEGPMLSIKSVNALAHYTDRPR
jgi:cbb3-type cytochrome oxidase subunit 1